MQADCRLAFTQWGLPDAIQTDHASLFTDDDATPFPTQLDLWWVGLGIHHQFIPRHTPECNGSVERSQRTLNERTLVGQTFDGAERLQTHVTADWRELNTQCASRAHDCHGLPPVVAHPDLLTPRRLYVPEREAEIFDLQRVDACLSQFTWVRTVNSHGQLSLGSQRYGVGVAWAGQKVAIRFEPAARTFVFTALQPEKLANGAPLALVTRPALGRNRQDIMGAVEPYHGPERQLPLPLSMYDPPAVALDARLSERSPEARD